MILIACDHGGVSLKEHLKSHLGSDNCHDLGVEDGQEADYPIIAKKLIEAYKTSEYQFGILICGTGIGVSIAANRFPGIRCALVTDVFSAKMAKEHNDANVIALGGRTLTPCVAKCLVDTFMEAQFQGGRHKDRVDLIEQIVKLTDDVEA